MSKYMKKGGLRFICERCKSVLKTLKRHGEPRYFYVKNSDNTVSKKVIEHQYHLQCPVCNGFKFEIICDVRDENEDTSET